MPRVVNASIFAPLLFAFYLLVPAPIRAQTPPARRSRPIVKALDSMSLRLAGAANPTPSPTWASW